MAKMRTTKRTTTKRRVTIKSRPIGHVSSANWENVARFSLLKQTEGGRGLSVLKDLEDAGIPARRCASPYVGHVGVEVPKRYCARADRIIFGGR